MGPDAAERDAVAALHALWSTEAADSAGESMAVFGCRPISPEDTADWANEPLDLSVGTSGAWDRDAEADEVFAELAPPYNHPNWSGRRVLAAAALEFLLAVIRPRPRPGPRPRPPAEGSGRHRLGEIPNGESPTDADLLVDTVAAELRPLRTRERGGAEGSSDPPSRWDAGECPDVGDCLGAHGEVEWEARDSAGEDVRGAASRYFETLCLISPAVL